MLDKVLKCCLGQGSGRCALGPVVTLESGTKCPLSSVICMRFCETGYWREPLCPGGRLLQAPASGWKGEKGPFCMETSGLVVQNKPDSQRKNIIGCGQQDTGRHPCKLALGMDILQREFKY